MKHLIKLFFTILSLNLFHNIALAADKYVGSGDLKLDDPDVKWFLKYLKPPAGQIPMTFFVLSEKNIASTKNLELLSNAMVYSSNFGLVFLWIAAALTLITGYEYLQKAWPHLKG